MERLLSSSINIASRLLQDGSVSPIEITSACINRIRNTKNLNAFIKVTNSLAEEQAEMSMHRLKRNESLDLDGITVALKDNFCTKNVHTTCASKMLENFKPPYNATVYQKLLEKGAILVGKTNMDQFAMGSGTVDSIFGPTKNPWNAGEDFFISGGSSGGSAVAVATGSCFAALGSDTGGSTRNPASYCGIVGLKPTYGLVSRYGLIPLVNSMDVPGILTRNIDDCALILNAIAGHDPNDSTTLRQANRKIILPPASRLSINNLKVGIPKEYHCEGLSEEVLETWNNIANLLKENGAVVREVSLPNTEHSIVCYSILNQCEVQSNMARYDGIEFGYRTNDNSSVEKLFTETRSQALNEVVRNRILAGNYFLLSRNYEKYFIKAMKVRRIIMNDFYKVWDDVQILLTPTTLTTAPLYKDFISKTNRDQCAIQDFCTQSANMAGIPALTIPIKLSRGGMPISLQLMGRNLSEPMLLAVGKFIENVVQFPQYSHKNR